MRDDTATGSGRCDNDRGPTSGWPATVSADMLHLMVRRRASLAAMPPGRILRFFFKRYRHGMLVVFVAADVKSETCLSTIVKVGCASVRSSWM
jgi:hypothetical protein